MKILQLITKSEPIGGAQMVLFNIVSGLKNKHDIYVISGQNGRLIRELENLDIKCIIFPSLKRELSIINDINALLKFKMLLKEMKPDLVVSHSSKAGYISRIICNQLKIPNIFTVHGWSFTTGVPLFKRIPYLFLEKIAGKISDKIICVSNYDKELALKYNITQQHRVRTIYNGSSDLLHRKQKKVFDILNVVMVARFQKQKDHETLFKALEGLLNKRIVIHLIGDGPLEEKYKLMSRKMKLNNLVKFHGSRNDVGVFLNNADLFLLISNYEGLPLSIIEAMSCGLPIIASNVGGVKELVINNENGFLINKGDYHHLQKSLEYILNNPNILNQLGKNSRKLFLERFTVDIMVSKTESFYKEAIEEYPF